MKKPITTDGYTVLFNKVRKTLIEGRRRIEQERVLTHWETGHILCADLLQHKDRAEYGAEVLERLADDLELNVRLLQRCIQFAKAYPRLPNTSGGTYFKWSHYRELITVADDQKRLQFTKMALQNDWSAQELASHIKKTRPRPHVAHESRTTDSQPVARLTFTRGRLGAYALAAKGIDFGFKVRFDPQVLGFLRVPKAEYVQIPADKKTGLRKITPGKDELYTYRASIVKIVDGDTLNVDLTLGLGLFIEQRLRLRGINCLEMDTEEGQKAKRFVAARLKNLDKH